MQYRCYQSLASHKNVSISFFPLKKSYHHVIDTNHAILSLRTGITNQYSKLSAVNL